MWSDLGEQLQAQLVSSVAANLNFNKLPVLLGAICEFAQFINCAAQFVNSQFAQKSINCCANCESYYARSVYKLRNEVKLRNL